MRILTEAVEHPDLVITFMSVIFVLINASVNMTSSDLIAVLLLFPFMDQTMYLIHVHPYLMIQKSLSDRKSKMKQKCLIHL